MKRRFILAAAVLLALTASCTTTETVIDENLSPGEYFRLAQTASSDYDDYSTALAYYEAFIERYPDDAIMIIEAEYEIAFLYYKMGDKTTAEKLFNGIIDKYSRPEAAILPAWPRVLSSKMLDKINNTTAEE